MFITAILSMCPPKLFACKFCKKAVVLARGELELKRCRSYLEPMGVGLHTRGI
jgi:hypothetical protein